MRRKASFPVQDVLLCKRQMLSWMNRFSICCFMDGHDYKDAYSVYDCIGAAGAADICLPEKNKLSSLQAFTQKNKDWLFGHVAYDLKNEIENLHSFHEDNLLFPDLFFFQPDVVLYIKNGELIIESLHRDAEDVYIEIMSCEVDAYCSFSNDIDIQNRISREDYLSTIQILKQHILRGDCYEINFCQEFFAEAVLISPLPVYQRLSVLSASPFAAYYKLDDKYLLCASPERFMQKRNEQLISQPMKGTAGRIPGNETLDHKQKQQLQYSEKDRAENVMIADLVRNDLSRICKRNSVEVKELFGVYSYPQVHQMITTVAGRVDKDISIADALQAMFPMGSMTGAPKRKVMELTEQYERSKRGLYSGSVGYITPENDWDFNVVIRSLLYNESCRYLSFQVGSAITWGSVAEEEYAECLLKAEAMQNAINA